MMRIHAKGVNVVMMVIVEKEVERREEIVEDIGWVSDEIINRIYYFKST